MLDISNYNWTEQQIYGTTLYKTNKEEHKENVRDNVKFTSESDLMIHR